ncbi:hypothetical protein [Arthrobacter pityocampae]|uniref:hypothetical protein n=1 Tax=Arthrobacter pityocampae TaxID=547334 RepID=UPI003734DC68
MSHSVITDELRAGVRACHAKGLGRNAIADELGVARGTITKVANELGLDFDRTKTEVATKARSIDQRARRQDIIDRLYKRAETVLDRLEAETFDALVPSAPGVQSHEVLPFVPATEERGLAGAMGFYLSSAEKLEKVDADKGAADGVSMVSEMMAGLKKMYETAPEPEVTDPDVG